VRSQQIEQMFLQFQFANGEGAVIPAEIAAEIRLVEAPEILPIPQMPAWVLGIFQWQSEMIWTIDLGYSLGYSPLSWQEKNPLVVLELDKQYFGCVVSVAKEIQEYDLLQLQAPRPDLFSSELIPFLQGFFLKAEREIVRLLDMNAIVAACFQQSLDSSSHL
jgi:positive phototaxis protein PixI